MLRSLPVHAVLLVACSSTPTPESPASDAPRTFEGELADVERVAIWPQVALLPDNALTFRISVLRSQELSGPTFTIFAQRGGVWTEVPGSLPRWVWNEDVTQARLEPKGLERGRPYLLVAEGLVGEEGPFPPTGRTFRVGPPDTTPPNGAEVVLRGAPEPGSTAPLTLTFPEAMREDVVHSLAVLDGGQARPEPWSLSDDQLTATLTPASPWHGEVLVSVGGSAKDVAGNTIRGLPDGMLRPQVGVE